MLVFEWPSRCETTFTGTPAASASVAAVCLNPWNLIRRTSAFFTIRSNYVVQGSTLTFNPTVPQSVIDKAFEEDEASAAAECGAQFRRDIVTFIPIEVVEACTVDGRVELAPVPGT